MKNKKIIEKLNTNLEKIRNTDLTNEIFNKFEGWHDEDENVICYWTGQDWNKFSTLFFLLPINSVLKNKQKIHIFTHDKEVLNNNILFLYLNTFWKNNKNIKVTVLSDDDLNIYEKLLPNKRALKWGGENNFARFNLWLIKNIEYKNLFLIHNDVFLLKNINNLVDDIGDISSFVSHVSIGKDSVVPDGYLDKLPSMWGVSSEDFKNKQLHTGFLFMNKKARENFNSFIENNYDVFIESIKYFRFPEQDILILFYLSLKNVELKYFNKYEESMWRKNVPEKPYIIHMDHFDKSKLFLNWEINNENKHLLTPIWKEAKLFEKRLNKLVLKTNKKSSN